MLLAEVEDEQPDAMGMASSTMGAQRFGLLRRVSDDFIGSFV